MAKDIEARVSDLEKRMLAVEKTTSPESGVKSVLASTTYT